LRKVLGELSATGRVEKCWMPKGTLRVNALHFLRICGEKS